MYPTNTEDARTPKKKRKWRLTDLDVRTVGLVDVPAVEGSRFIIAKSQNDDLDELGRLLNDEPVDTVKLTPSEIAYYRFREKDEAAYGATIDWLAHLPNEQFEAAIAAYDYDPDAQRKLLHDVDEWLLHDVDE